VLLLGPKFVAVIVNVTFDPTLGVVLFIVFNTFISVVHPLMVTTTAVAITYWVIKRGIISATN
jgi:hypothetical protein